MVAVAITGAVGLGVPTSKGIACAGESIGGEVLCCAIGKVHIAHLACGIGVVLVELHGIGIVFLYGSEGHITVGTIYRVGIAGEGIAAGLINDVIACGDVEVGGERQLKPLAIVAFAVINEAVVHVGGGRGDAGDAAAEGYLAGAAYVGAGIVIVDSVKGATIEIEVLEGAIAIAANGGRCSNYY